MQPVHPAQRAGHCCQLALARTWPPAARRTRCLTCRVTAGIGFAERLSYRDQTLDEDLMHLGISPHPRVVLAIEGETGQIHVPLIWKQLDCPDAPELLRLLMLGGVDRDLEKVAALAAAPLIGQKAPSQNPAWLLIKPPTCLYIAVDPEGQYFAPANVPQTQTAILNEIRAVLRAQGVRAANRAEVEELVRICTCYCPAMQPGR